MEKLYIKEYSERRFWRVLMWLIVALLVIVVIVTPRQPKQTKIVSEVSGQFGTSFEKSVERDEVRY